jgi:putative ABC transport system permease protein
MTRHVFKLVWQRKRSTGLILLEILVCFLVLCGLLASSVNLAIRWREPLGFRYDNVWRADVEGMNWQAEGEELAANRRAMADLLDAVQGMPDVESAAVSTNTPYNTSTWADGTWIDGRQVHFLWTLASPELREVLDLKLLHGRWIEATDAALGYRPVVLSRDLARDMFGIDDPVGRNMPVFDDDGEPTEVGEDAEINRVVGVLDNYRRGGEFQETEYTMFLAVDFDAGEELPSELVIRVRPGTTADFEERLVRTLLSVAPQWSYDTSYLENTRRSRHKDYVGPIVIAVVVALFLIIMVGLGLVGVLWLSVTRRTAELGLRRAMGASIGSVRRQILGELWALTAMAVVVGALIFLQFPLFGANFGASWPVFLAGLTLATLVIYGFVTFCGLYPTWLATRVRPAIALQYE